MAAMNFAQAVRRLLAHEGGYANHPADPGGPTNHGITLADYRRYVKADASAADVKAMPLSHAVAIYRARYWNALSCDDLPAGLDYAAFDYAVNSGTGRAAKVLARLVWRDRAGGAIDAVTLAAIRARDPSALIGALCDERLAFLKSLKTWPVFGRGWQRRVAEVRAAALSMAQRKTQAGRDAGDGKRPNAGAAAQA